MKVSNIRNDKINAHFKHFAGHLTSSYNFRRHKKPGKLKTANINPHVFEAKNAKIWRRENIPFYAIIDHFILIVFICMEKSIRIQSVEVALSSLPCLGPNPGRSNIASGRT